MAKSEQEIKADITEYIRKGGGGYPAWYVGVTKDPRRRLFTEHGVHEEGDLWIFRQAYSSAAARNVEAHFLSLGADGGAGGGEQDADYVYAYKKSAHTNP